MLLRFIDQLAFLTKKIIGKVSLSLIIPKNVILVVFKVNLTRDALKSMLK